MRIKLPTTALTGLLCLGASGVTFAQPAAAPSDIGHIPELALTVLQAAKHATLTVTSPSFKNDGDIPNDNTQYGKNIFPGLSWTHGPAATRSYVVVIQGASYGNGPTSIQFTLFNVPAATTQLEVGMTDPPAGAVYGPNVHGTNKPYAGPHTHTDDRHAYHVQVFALDTVLQVPPTVHLDALESVMMGHVLASGDLVAYTAKPVDQVYKPNKG